MITLLYQVSAASVNGQLGYESLGAYCASKHAVIGISRCAARENPDIRVNCIAPGMTVLSFFLTLCQLATEGDQANPKNRCCCYTHDAE